MKLPYFCHAMLPQNPGGQACSYSNCDFVLLDSSPQYSPVHFYVCGDIQTHGWIRARRHKLAYKICIWNSRIVRSTCFSLGSFDGASETSASVVLAICVAMQFEASLNKLVPRHLQCPMWTAVEISGLRPISYQIDEQKTKPMILSSRSLFMHCSEAAGWSHLLAMPAMVSFVSIHDSERENRTNKKKKNNPSRI